MRIWSLGTILAAMTIASVLATHATAGAATVATPATAAGERPGELSAVAVGPAAVPVRDDLVVSPPTATTEPTAAPTVEPVAPTAEPVEPAVAPVTVAAAAATPSAPRPTTAPVPVVAPARTAAPTPVPTEATCPATWFCYPRLGIAGQIVPYTDCSGSTDVGTSIRSYSCLSQNYLMGHAYTQFGLVTQWVAGDVVFAWGHRFTVYSALTEQSCAAPVFPLAPLSMQTSLSSAACGPVLVVQAR